MPAQDEVGPGLAPARQPFQLGIEILGRGVEGAGDGEAGGRPDGPPRLILTPVEAGQDADEPAGTLAVGLEHRQVLGQDRFTRGFGGHIGVAVAVASHPGPEGDRRRVQGQTFPGVLVQGSIQRAQVGRHVGGAAGTAADGDYFVDGDRRAVGVGGGAAGTRIHAAFREGIGCVVMAPGQDLDDIDALPSLLLPPPPGNPEEIPWPNGDRVEPAPLGPGIDASALQAASDWAFERESPEQVTLSLIVVHGGAIIHERYAEGVGKGTRTRTWSTAKSIAATLIGMLVDRGTLALHYGDQGFDRRELLREVLPAVPRVSESP